jgi:hypothetical protein
MNIKVITKWTAAALACITMTVNAQTLIDETFEGVEIISNANPLVTSSGTWRSLGGTAGLNIVNSTLYNHNVFNLGVSTTAFYRAFDGGQTFTLNSLDPGQSISITLNLAFGNSPSSSWGNATYFDFGLINYDDIAANQRSLYTSVGIHGSSTQSKFYTRAQSQLMGNGYNSAQIGSTWQEITEEAPQIEINQNYSLVFTITRQEEDFLLEYYRDGILLGSAVNTLSAYADADFSGIGLRPSALSNSSLLDSITVSIIPEPSALALLGIGALTLVVLKFRGSKVP